MNPGTEHSNWTEINTLISKLKAEFPGNTTLGKLEKVLHSPEFLPDGKGTIPPGHESIGKIPDNPKVIPPVNMASQEELRKTRFYQDIIFSHLEGMDVFLVDKDLRFLYSAGKEKNYFNLRDEDFTGKTLYDILPVSTRRTLIPLYKSALQGNQIKKEIRYSSDIFEINASPVKNQYGETIAAVIVTKNITREKADRNKLKKDKQAAQAADRAKSLFLASMSHEIRTPLNTIIGFANLLAKTHLTAEQNKYIKLIGDSSDQLINVVNELLIIFKIEMSKVFIDEVPFSIRSIFEELGEIFEADAKLKDLDLSFTVARKVPNIVSGDPFRVKQVLLNLVSNAIKYTDSGSVRLSCKVADDRKRTIYLSFNVEDTGIGIPHEEIPYIFDEFRQAQNLENKHRHGTGLGLTITKKLVELQKGKISLKSTLNKGTSITITQPFVKSRKKDIVRKQSQYDLKFRLMAGKRVLLVDDDEQNLMLADVLFKEWGIKYETTNDAEHGFELSRINKYDVVLLDIHMPKINGMDLMQMIRQNTRNPNNQSKIITITANILQSDLKRYLQGGFDDYILKPFREEELYSKLCHVLGIKNISAQTLPEGERTETSESEVSGADFSLEELIATARGDQEFINRTIQVFIDNTKQSKSVMENSLQEKKWSDIGEAAHKMISSFRYFRCEKIVKNLIALETMALRTQEFDPIPEKVKETIALIDTTLEKIIEPFNFQTI